MTTTLANVLLVRYATGHLYLDQSAGHERRELYLELGDVRDRDTAEDLGRRYLDSYAESRYSDAIEGTVLNGAQVPTVSFRLGDTIAGHRLNAYTATLTGEGVTSIVPELDDPFDVEEEAFARQVRIAGTGLFSEYAKPTITRAATGQATDTTPPEFSQDGPVVVSYSPIWRAPRPWWGAWLDVALAPGGSGSTPTIVTVARLTDAGDVVNVANAILGAGERRALARIDRGWVANEGLLIRVDLAGLGADKLTASLRGAMV